MISASSRAQGVAVRPAGLSGEGEVVHPGDAQRGVVDSVAFQPAVAEELPSLHPGDDVFDAPPAGSRDDLCGLDPHPPDAAQ